MLEARPEIKMVIVGDAFVGKTSLVTSYLTEKFEPVHSPTVGAAIKEKVLTYEGQEYKLNMWDTAGQETYRNIVPVYFRGADIGVIVIDVTNDQAIASFEYWREYMHEYLPNSVIIILCANKIDMTANRVITTEEIEKVAGMYNIPFFETSAKSNVGISNLFEHAFYLYVQKSGTYKDKANSVQFNDNTSNCSC